MLDQLILSHKHLIFSPLFPSFWYFHLDISVDESSSSAFFSAVFSLLLGLYQMNYPFLIPHFSVLVFIFSYFLIVSTRLFSMKELLHSGISFFRVLCILNSLMDFFVVWFYKLLGLFALLEWGWKSLVIFKLSNCNWNLYIIFKERFVEVLLFPSVGYYQWWNCFKHIQTARN